MRPDSIGRRELALLAIAIVPIIVVLTWVAPYPQPESYFDFADRRALIGIPNFWNVASNALFLIFGIAGILAVLGGERIAIVPDLRPAYVILFAGIALTAFGSGWFHLAPGDETLFWDRLPMTIAFMSLFAVILGEHVSTDLGRILLWPLLVAGTASVIYWDYTEAMGSGDLRAYGIVQFLPMLLMPAILVLYRSAFDTTSFLWATIGLYALAKLFEIFDAPVYAAGNILSGHSLKHIAASLVPLVLLNGMRNRRRTR